MESSKKLINFLKDILKKESEVFLDKISKKCIRELQSFKQESGMMQSGEYTVLNNVWDEICVQTQYDYSIYWDLYIDMITSLIEKHLIMFNTNQLLILWLQTESGWSWFYDIEHNELETFQLSLLDNGIDEPLNFFDNTNIPSRYNTDDIIQEILNNIINISSNYHNKAINKFLDNYELI